MWAPAREFSGIMSRSTSTASCWMMRILPISPSATSLHRLPTPGVCTSTSMKLVSGRAVAILAEVSPMPKPISNTVGASRPKVAAKSRASGRYAMPTLGIMSSR